jgi:hypothetical protein
MLQKWSSDYLVQEEHISNDSEHSPNHRSYPLYYPPVKNRQVINQLWNFGVTKLGNLGNYMTNKRTKKMKKGGKNKVSFRIHQSLS